MMNALANILAARIGETGPLSFAEFMEAALYHPEHGYYASGRAAIGRGGDYFTNISVGPLFGRLLMWQFAEMWERLGQPATFGVVEQGAHAGDFAQDVLEGARELEPAFFEAIRFTIIEPVPGPGGEAASAACVAMPRSSCGWKSRPRFRHSTECISPTS